MNHVVAVRALCEFGARTGDLDLRFTPGATAQEGIEGHALVRTRRAVGYESEIGLSGEFKTLRVRGRADGYDPADNRLEEIKTCRGRAESIPDNQKALHWAQAKTYAHLLCRQRGLDRIHVALVYFDVDEGRESMLVEDCAAPALELAFLALCERYLAWAEQEQRHRQSRDQACQAMAFPHAGFRAGQRTLAESVYKASCQRRQLIAQAPTGIGKTVGTLFPMLKAAPREQLDKILFLTAKTSGRQLALDALALLAPDDSASNTIGPRVLELTAREKTCEYPDLQCHGESCPLARGFYDKLPHARHDAVNASGILDQRRLRDIALRHELCPYWLGQELAKWCDVIVGDYNYYFDTSALLYSLGQERQWRTALLVDEAHNLLERARSMYSAELCEADIIAARPAAPPAMRKRLDALLRAWRKAFQDQPQAYCAYEEPPAGLLPMLQRAGVAMAEHFTQAAVAPHPDLQSLHFLVQHFLKLSESFGSHSIYDLTLSPAQGGRNHSVDRRLCLRNMIPAPHLQERFAASHGCVLFSATLTPWHFYRDTLGLPADTAYVNVAAPFHAEQLDVRIAGHISTRYADRERSAGPIAQLMAQQYRQRPGNYLSYFSSFDYLERCAQAFMLSHPDIPVWTQSRRMSETDRADFLARFTPEGTGIGFAVLGGALSEGIDLPGTRLIGAFVSTLGLPQVNPVNEQRMRCMEQVFGKRVAYDYAYLYPGLQKVVQAAGRVIRSPTDQGVLHLIDDRYLQTRIRGLLPDWWQVDYDGATKNQTHERGDTV
ncbi:ATP-dependent DNA helicase [Parapusillimonas sp. JC17]|uniref:ATP-dependent DNA helicase n=1 Tax=Parapusillimonas sp. JC17 TaxID=3445768 RepID=UPI003FA09775